MDESDFILTKDELIKTLRMIAKQNDKYIGHIAADTALLMYIDDDGET